MRTEVQPFGSRRPKKACVRVHKGLWLICACSMLSSAVRMRAKRPCAERWRDWAFECKFWNAWDHRHALEVAFCRCRCQLWCCARATIEAAAACTEVSHALEGLWPAEMQHDISGCCILMFVR
mmetsp:Transcript_55783/g.145472  ORF Transcript_55783/g.145472 Transcript_55783/m.145472 type:complete len:123 (-) Transcript_55783:8-376(-)